MKSKAERTKELIIERAAAVFNTKGFAGTSLNDMTEVTGLTKGSIYGNFKNKDDVAIEVFKFNLGTMVRLFQLEMEKKPTYREKLLVYPEVLSDFSEDRLPKGGCPILNTAVESDDTHPELKQLACAALMRWKNRIIELLQAGIAAGEFHSDLQIEKVAVTMLAMLEGAIMVRKLTDNQEYIKMIMESLSDFIKRL